MRKYVTEFTGTFGLAFTVSCAVKGSSRDAFATVLTWQEHEITELAAVLAVGAARFRHPDTGRGHMAGQARAVAARALDADQGDGPEPGQPARQWAYPAAVTGNSFTPGSPPTGSSAAATCTSAGVPARPVMARLSS